VSGQYSLPFLQLCLDPPFLLSVVITSSSKMPLKRKSPQKCHSTAAVTAGFLLSFLALSTPIAATASHQQPSLLPVLNPLPFTPESPESTNNEHVFVCFIHILWGSKILTYLSRRYATSSTTGFRTLPFTRDSTSRHPARQYGWSRRMAT
jgi:hypothetical protein